MASWLPDWPDWAWMLLASIISKLLFTLFFLWKDCDMLLWFYRWFGKSPKRALKDKVVWITGASSGIGAAVALELAKAGSKLVLSARRKSMLEAVKRRCLLSTEGRLTDGDILVLPMDVEELSCHEKKLQEILEHFGKLDVLVNNAGRSHVSWLLETELEVTRKTFEVNFFATVNLTKLVASKWLENDQEGHLVVTSCTSGITPMALSSSYSASKYALHGFFESLRLELFKQKIRVTIICPGPVADTELNDTNLAAKDGEKRLVRTLYRPMRLKRCAKLYAIAMANRTCESWIARQPALSAAYFALNLPTVFRVTAPRRATKERLFKHISTSTSVCDSVSAC